MKSLPIEVLEQIIIECKEKNAHLVGQKPKEIPLAVQELMRKMEQRKGRQKRGRN